MGNFIAILILVACPVGRSVCIQQPVRIVSYDSSMECRENRDMEVRKASRPGFEILGDCNTFSGALLAGKAHLNVTRDIATLDVGTVKSDPSEALAGFSR